MRLAHLPVAALFVLGCRNEGNLVVTNPDVTLRVDTPEYGEFMGDAPATVTGQVTPAFATVTIEGEVVQVDPDGWFTAEVPVDHAYRILDVEATLAQTWVRERVPVFYGHDPAETWPGGVTMRLTPSGLEHVGRGLGGAIDQLGWDQMIADQLPGADLGFIALTPVGVTHDPTVVDLLPAVGGVDTLIGLRNVDLVYDVTIDFDGNPYVLPMTIGYETIGIGALAVPAVDGDGMVSLTLTDANIVLQDPDITIAGLDGWLLEILLDGVALLLEPVGELLLDTVLDQFGAIELGGPYAFETDMMGTPISVRLSDVFGDLGGLGAGLGMSFGENAPSGPLGIPTPTSDRVDVHAALGIHEGLMQVALLESGMLDQFSQEIELPGIFGEVIGAGIRNLPGGNDAPDGDGWCLSIEPMDARVVRLQEGLNPWTVVYLPDMIVDIGVMNGSSCDSWLVASMAFEVGLDVRQGTQISMDIEIPEGAVLEYGADPGWEEAEVVEGLSGFMGGAMDLLGGQFSIDLADLMGGLGDVSDDPIFGALGELDPKIVGSEILLDDGGNHPEGLYALQLQLWAE